MQLPRDNLFVTESLNLFSSYVTHTYKKPHRKPETKTKYSTGPRQILQQCHLHPYTSEYDCYVSC